MSRQRREGGKEIWVKRNGRPPAVAAKENDLRNAEEMGSIFSFLRDGGSVLSPSKKAGGLH